ncbi:hypothetical protein EHLJMEHL_03006 [Vreelandella titanicae]
MNQEIAIKVTNAHNRIKLVRETLGKFLDHLKSHTDPEGLPSKISIEDGVISVDCFGTAISAVPRTVSDGASRFAIEYVFYNGEAKKSEEVWRFYLTSEGYLVNTLERQDSICDFDNRFIAKYICLSVLSNALDSSMFLPCEHAAG